MKALTFADLIGQADAVAFLRGVAARGRIGNAYLLHGPAAPVQQEHGAQAGACGKHDRLGENESHQAQSRDAERKTDRDLALACDCASDLQIYNIGACNEQDDRRKREQPRGRRRLHGIPTLSVVPDRRQKGTHALLTGKLRVMRRAIHA